MTLKKKNKDVLETRSEWKKVWQPKKTVMKKIERQNKDYEQCKGMKIWRGIGRTNENKG